tara:strand:+ start:855 stop:1661 length:807 start_codon:yes stop_codon:yes gene_type:complete
MDKIVRKHIDQSWALQTGRKRYNEKEYFIYPEKEAKQQKIEYKYWQDCLPGEWGITDDGYVAECLKRREYTDRNKPSINLVFPFGQCFTGKRKLKYLPHKETGEFNQISSKSSWELNKTRTCYKNFVRAYAQMFIADNISYGRLGKIFNKKEPIPAAKAKALLKKQYIQEMVDKELERLMSKKGVTKGTVIDMILEAANLARKKEQAANLLRAAEDLVEIFGMKEKQKQIDTFEAEFVSLQSIEEAAGLSEPVEPLKLDKKGMETIAA